MPAKKILFIAYDASRSGAVKLLLNLSQAIKEVSECKVDFIFRTGGTLLQDFKLVGNVSCINAGKKKLLDKLAGKIFNRDAYIIKKVLGNKYDHVIVNTVLNTDVLPVIKKNYTGKIICYVHELKAAIEFLNSSSRSSVLFDLTDIFLVPGASVKNLFVAEYNISDTKIKILPYYIPSGNQSLNQPKLSNSFVVGGCGSVELRKGTDLFVQLAQVFKKNYPGANVQFVWTGGNESSLEFKLLLEDIRKLNLDNIRLQPAVDNVDDFYSAIDVLVLTSREDPYPLVVLEAADAKVPGICFKHSGGATEFIEGNGKIVEYLNVDQLASAVYEYYKNPELKMEDGEKAKQKLLKLHQDKTKIVKQFFENIQ